jgi:hypothetical protein
VGMQDPNYSNQ